MSDTLPPSMHASGENVEHAAEALDSAVPHGAEHGEDIGSIIMHHVTDGNTLEVPFLGEIRLPHLEIGGLDLSITRYVVMMWLAGLILILLFSLAFRRRDRVPRGFANLLEMLVVFVRDELAIKNIGKQGRAFVPYLLTTFFFILTCNLLGMVPFMATATGSISVTAGLALLAFLMIQWGGIREHGLIGHLKPLVVPPGAPVWLLPLMIPIWTVVEIIGMLAKPFALCVRLFANMTAGHIVILSLFGLIFIMESYAIAPVSVAFALFISLLEILVAFIQAYIFTMLTSLFIGMTVHAH